MKQSAVEWYSEEHWKLFLQLESKEITTSEYIDEHQILLVQAKELEKENHSNTWDDSRVFDMGDDYLGKQKSFQEYYNEKFKNK